MPIGVLPNFYSSLVVDISRMMNRRVVFQLLRVANNNAMRYESIAATLE